MVQFDRDGRAQARRIILAGLRNHLGAVITGHVLQSHIVAMRDATA